MGGIAVRATLRGADVAVGELEAIEARARDLTPLMRQIGAVLMRSIDRNFEEGGRPAKWAPRAPSTVAALVAEFQQRAKQTRRYQSARRETTRAGILERAGTVASGHNVLVESGSLRQSTTMEAGPTFVRVGTADKRAALLNFGGTVHVPALQAKEGGALRFYGRDGAAIFAKRTRAHDVTIPARPFVLMQDEDGEAITLLTTEYLAGGPESVAAAGG